jgi:hypothetical protein
MKYTGLFIFFIALASCHAQQTIQMTPAAPAAPATATTPVKQQMDASSPADQKIIRSKLVRWDKTMINLGPVKKGEKRTLFYEMTNVSGQDIQIDIVDACTCTTVEYPRGVIHPGEKKRLDVEFNSEEKEAAETIDIHIIYKQTDPGNNPLIDEVQYMFEIVK